MAAWATSSGKTTQVTNRQRCNKNMQNLIIISACALAMGLLAFAELRLLLIEEWSAKLSVLFLMFARCTTSRWENCGINENFYRLIIASILLLCLVARSLNISSIRLSRLQLHSLPFRWLQSRIFSPSTIQKEREREKVSNSMINMVQQHEIVSSEFCQLSCMFNYFAVAAAARAGWKRVPLLIRER